MFVGGQDHDDFEQVAGAVGTEHEPAVGVLAGIFDDEGVVEGVEDVVVVDAVAAGRVSNLHTSLSFYKIADHPLLTAIGAATVSIDVLAPDGLGSRTDLTTTPPGRTIQVPGGTQALDRTELLPVRTLERTGLVPRPSLLGAVVAKAIAVGVDDLPNGQRLDLAFLLGLVDDPFDASPVNSHRPIVAGSGHAATSSTTSIRCGGSCHLRTPIEAGPRYAS